MIPLLTGLPSAAKGTLRKYVGISLAFAFAAHWLVASKGFPARMDDLVSNSLSIGALMVGLLATGQTFYLSLTPTEIFRQLKKLKLHLELPAWCAFGMAAGLAATLASLLAMTLTKKPMQEASSDLWLFDLWVATWALAVQSFIKALRILHKVIQASLN